MNIPTLDAKTFANRLRLSVLRMTSAAGSSHIGSAFSCADIVAVLYARVLKIDPAAPRSPDRDRFILSKGHAGAIVYAALAERGFFPPTLLDSYYSDESALSGHISHENVPGVELSTGSLGHGLPVATGMALAAARQERAHRVICLLSDGECDEGSNWEAILFAAHHGLDHLTAIVDYNKIQSLASVAETLALEPFATKWSAFGWGVREVDGHDHEAIETALTAAPAITGRPTCIIAHTTKGKGVPFMENSVLWHYRTARGAEFEAAKHALEAGE